MSKVRALAIVMLLVAPSCLGAGSAPPTILVDFSHDQFVSIFLKFFPSRVAVEQGDELVFKQTWTGEPHTVTGGKLADKVGEAMRPYLLEGKEIPDEPPSEVLEVEEAIGGAYGDEGLNQTLAQPCYIDSGEVPTDGEPCDTQDQPRFDGSQVLYNSGVIPYEGPQGNEFRVSFAEDTEPGTYFFYCVVHGPLQSSYIEVKEQGAGADSAQDVARRAREEINELAGPYLDLFERARDDGEITVKSYAGHTQNIEGNFAGIYDRRVIEEGSGGEAMINEFIPRRITARAGEPITWNLIGWHTISFGVPEYFPILEFEEDGTVAWQDRVEEVAGGATEFDMTEEEQYDETRTEPVRFDGGTYDGEGFWSSGAIDADPYVEYTMTITEPGTYRYACLVHPPMVGTVEVT